MHIALIGFLMVLLVVFLIGQFVYSQRRKRRELKERLRQEWGKEKEAYRDFDQIKLYHQYQQESAEQQDLFLSKQTANDLNMEQVFARMDHCQTTIGQQYLYHLLHVPRHEQLLLEQRNKLICFFQKNEKAREVVSLELAILKGKLSYAFPRLLHQWGLKASKYQQLFRVLGTIPMLWIGLSFINPVFLFLVFLNFTVNVFVHYSLKDRLDLFLYPIKQVILMRQCRQRVAELHPDFQKEPLVAACEELAPIKRYNKLLASGKSYESELAAFMSLILEYIKITFLLEVNVMDNCLSFLASKKEAIHELYRFTGETDALLAMASFREGLPYYCEPILREEAEASLKVEEVYHPMLEGCQPNSLALQGQGAVITSSNMSGKTTFIRTLSLNALLAQTIYTVLARSYEASFFHICTSIRIKDDLDKGSSYYLEEIESVHALLKHSRTSQFPQLLVIDELFKGTNTTERIAAARAVLLYLNQASTMVLVSTHDLELAHLLKESYRQYHFSETIQQGELYFDHKLKEGPLRSRNSIRLLELVGYPKAIIKAAEEHAGLLPEALDTA